MFACSVLLLKYLFSRIINFGIHILEHALDKSRILLYCNMLQDNHSGQARLQICEKELLKIHFSVLFKYTVGTYKSKGI